MQTYLSLNSPKRILRLKAWRAWMDRQAHHGFYILAVIPMILLVVMLGVLIYRSYPILQSNSIWNLLTGRTWLPSRGEFGFLPFIMGSAWVTVVAMILAVPPCLLTSIYLAEYARPSIRTVMKPMLDLLAAIPSVIYGVWGIIAIVPLVERFAPKISQFLGNIPLFAVKHLGRRDYFSSHGFPIHHSSLLRSLAHCA
jgi:phosphate transport system permease protein